MWEDEYEYKFASKDWLKQIETSKNENVKMWAAMAEQLLGGMDVATLVKEIDDAPIEVIEDDGTEECAIVMTMEKNCREHDWDREAVKNALTMYEIDARTFERYSTAGFISWYYHGRPIN